MGLPGIQLDARRSGGFPFRPRIAPPHGIFTVPVIAMLFRMSQKRSYKLLPMWSVALFLVTIAALGLRPET